VNGNSITNSQGQGDNPVCSTRDDISQPSRPFSPRAATASQPNTLTLNNRQLFIIFQYTLHAYQTLPSMKTPHTS